MIPREWVDMYMWAIGLTGVLNLQTFGIKLARAIVIVLLIATR